MKKPQKNQPKPPHSAPNSELHRRNPARAKIPRQAEPPNHLTLVCVCGTTSAEFCQRPAAGDTIVLDWTCPMCARLLHLFARPASGTPRH